MDEYKNKQTLCRDYNQFLEICKECIEPKETCDRVIVRRNARRISAYVPSDLGVNELVELRTLEPYQDPGAC